MKPRTAAAFAILGLFCFACRAQQPQPTTPLASSTPAGSPTQSGSPSETPEPEEATPSPTPTRSTAAAPTASRCGPSGARKAIRYAVEIEKSIPITRAELRKFLQGAYCDKRGWTRTGRVSFQPVDKRTKGVTRIQLLKKAGVKRECSRLLGEQSSGNYSCASTALNEIVLNYERWSKGASEFNAMGGTMTQYRTMVSTHEMGHVLDLRHQMCTTQGGLAPVMMQQSISMKSSSTGKTCKPNPWPLQHEINRLRNRWS